MDTKPDNQKSEKSSTHYGVRYSPEMGDRLVEAIREVCSIMQASKVLGIPDKTIYGWLTKYPDLKLRLQIAQKQYYAEQDTENIFKAKERIKDYLFKGSLTKKITYNSEGLVEKTEVTSAPTPQWVIDRILGGNDEINALKTLASTGWIPDGLATDIVGSLDDSNVSIKELFRARLQRMPGE